MKVEKVVIERFRGIVSQSFDMGSHVTAITGQNGTQKTTLLGIISQTFSLEKNEMRKERPLSGGSYKSSFSDMFKFSDKHDKPGAHEWTLHFDDNTEFPVESIPRSGSEIRFWRKGTRKGGSGYIQLPVVYLSLKRLSPIGEDPHIQPSEKVKLTPAESEYFKIWHNKILILNDEVTSGEYVSSTDKTTIGGSCDFYDWQLNSAGQDNVGKIILAVLSFMRLKKDHPSHYKGGLLAIDEIDATLYPAAQIELIRFLVRMSAKHDFQVVFTTHSAFLLKHLCDIQNEVKRSGQVNVVFAKKYNGKIKLDSKVTYDAIENNLNVAIGGSKKAAKLRILVEDNEAKVILRGILKGLVKGQSISVLEIGSNNMSSLAAKKIMGFTPPDSLLVLDGDARSDKQIKRNLGKSKNTMFLPGEENPETMIAVFLNSLDDESPFWESAASDYSKQFCFRKYSIPDITSRRETAKAWFKEQYPNWGVNACKVFKYWIPENDAAVKEFREQFRKHFNRFADHYGVPCR